MLYLSSGSQFVYAYFMLALLFLIPLSFFIAIQLLSLFNTLTAFYYLLVFNSSIFNLSDSIFNLLNLLVNRRLWFDSIKFMESKKDMSQGKTQQYFNALGFIYYGMQMYDIAKLYYEQSLDIDGKYIIAMQNLARVYESLKDKKSASLAYKRILEEDPYNKMARRYFDN